MNLARRTLGTRLFLAVVCCLCAPRADASSEIEALMDRAEEVRSSDPRAYRELLDDLNARAGSATVLQKERLEYLNAYALAFSGRHEDAVRRARRVFDDSRDPDLKYRAGALIVNSHASTRNFTEGLRQLNETLELTGKLRDPRNQLYGLWGAAVIYNQIGQYKLGLEYADKLLSIDIPERSVCFARHSRLESLQNLGALPRDDAAITSVIDYCQARGEVAAANFARTTLARKWEADSRRKQAISLLQDHLAEVHATRFPRLIGEVEALLAEMKLRDGDIAAAEAHARQAIALEGSIANSLPMVVAYRTMYEIAMRTNDPRAALDYYRRYSDADRRYLSDINARELAYQIVRQETQQKTQQIELLNRQNQVLQLQQRVDKQSQQNTQLLAAFLGLLLATIGYWAWKMKRVQGSFRRLAETDMLTGISNRHHFTRKAEEALEFCRRNIEDVGLILFDLDHFKSINDRFGHIVGDFVLIRVAEVCRASCRKNDRFARIGGEEFAILLVGCDLEATARMAQVFCRQIAAIDTSGSGHEFPVTASFGVTTASQSGYELSRMMSHADQMLYRSKNAGRNQVQVDGDARSPQRVPEEQRELFVTTAA